MSVRYVTFLAGFAGDWSVDRIDAIRGETLPLVSALARVEAQKIVIANDAAWTLSGVVSHERYLERVERERLARVQEDIGRPSSRRAVLIPICKRAVWWQMAQDERREIFETRSRHVAIGSAFLPAIARRLYHARDLGGPFDFLTWFEFAEEDVGAFDELVGRLRETEEWRYVDREVEVRLRRRG